MTDMTIISEEDLFVLRTAITPLRRWNSNSTYVCREYKNFSKV